MLAESGVLPDVVHTSLLRRAIRTREHRAGELRPALDPGRAAPGGSTSGTTARCRARTRSRRCRRTARRSSPMWRRSYDTPPPAIDPDDEYAQTHDPRYAGLAAGDPARHRVPQGRRASGCCRTGTTCIVPDLRAGQTVLVAAHGNSLRGAGQAPRRHERRRTSRAQHPHRASRWSTGSTRTSSRPCPAASTSTRRLPPVPPRRSPTRPSDSTDQPVQGPAARSNAASDSDPVQHEPHQLDAGRGGPDGAHGHQRRQLERVAVDPAGDRGERDSPGSDLVRDGERAQVAGRQQVGHRHRRWCRTPDRRCG